MSDYIKREDTIKALHDESVRYIKAICDVPSADVLEVGKAYPREVLEKYGLTEWKDKHGQRWVMIERKDDK